jgi:pyruvate,water dikinase
MNVVALGHGSGVELVGGKAFGLGEMIRAGERVPDGFCVTTAAHRSGVLPRDEIIAAYEGMGAATVAVRSSATTEDRPDTSFAGQYDTYLNVAGTERVLDAVQRCWDSLHAERAVAYGAGPAGALHGQTVHMAVVVQRMVDPLVAGVMFTANPVTGCRTEMVVDAIAGLGNAVVDGTVMPDHYVLNGHSSADGGCLTDDRLAELRQVGARLQHLFGSPQDVEWAFDRDGTLWLLQSRPITTLFPLPPDDGRPTPRVYLEFGHVQGMVRPVTPMGMSTLKALLANMFASFGIRVEIVDIGGRLYGDLTDLVRNRTARSRLVKLMSVDFGPRAQAVVEHVLADPRFAPLPGRLPRPKSALRTLPRAVGGVVGALARPEAARAMVFGEIERIRELDAGAGLRTTVERLDFLEAEHTSSGPDRIIWPVVTGILVAVAPSYLLKGIVEDGEVNTVLGGMPHNVTIEMDLALWRVANDHRDVLSSAPPHELAARFRAGTLPDVGLTRFLQLYGHRAAAEVDVGVPRWEEDPTPVFAMIANLLRVTDPEQAPDRRFRRAADAAEAKLMELSRRARRRRPVRGWLAGFFMRRARSLSGLREAGKFVGLFALRDRRRQLLLVGADLAQRGLLADADDIMFLTMPEARAAVENDADHRDLVVRRRAVHERELRRPIVPVSVLSDGTDVESLLRPTMAEPGALLGVGASAGKVTGPARVILDPTTAHIEPGEILVSPTTDPGWTPLFLTAAGLVTETGAIMAHGPTVAREYGIPAVICVPGATTRINTGQTLTLDGAAGTVTIDG